MLRRVTALAALGDRSPSLAALSGAAGHRYGTPFTEINRRRTRSSACARLVGLSWNFDPPATTRQDDKPDPLDFDPNALDA